MAKTETHCLPVKLHFGEKKVKRFALAGLRQVKDFRR